MEREYIDINGLTAIKNRDKVEISMVYDNYDISIKLPYPLSKQNKSFISKAYDTRNQLIDFLNISPEDEYEIISLGDICTPAWYIQEIGMRKFAYPFDWTLCSNQIVFDCIKNKFKDFLDKTKMVSGKGAVGHKLYHSKFFKHKNPKSKSNVDYRYYQRCCDRFLKKIHGDDNILYIIYLINEPLKNMGWSSGFVNDYKLPTNQSVNNIKELIEYLKDKNKNSKFLIISSYTQVYPDIGYNKINDYICTLKFYANGRSGLTYKNSVDDFCFKLMFTGLNKNFKNRLLK